MRRSRATSRRPSQLHRRQQQHKGEGEGEGGKEQTRNPEKCKASSHTLPPASVPQQPQIPRAPAPDRRPQEGPQGGTGSMAPGGPSRKTGWKREGVGPRGVGPRTCSHTSWRARRKGRGRGRGRGGAPCSAPGASRGPCSPWLRPPTRAPAGTPWACPRCPGCLRHHREVRGKPLKTSERNNAGLSLSRSLSLCLSLYLSPSLPVSSSLCLPLSPSLPWLFATTPLRLGLPLRASPAVT